MVTLSEAEYNELVADSKLLTALRAAGVDNWEGYSDALSSIEEDDA